MPKKSDEMRMSERRNRRPILVTGIHRSGSTWVGQMIGASDQVGYIHEPFSPTRGPGICRARFAYAFTYVPPDTDGAVERDFRRMLEFKYNYGAQALGARSRADLRALVGDGGRFLRYRLNGVRPLLKDPMAVFSAEWIAEAFDAQVVVVVRHPAAFVSSIKRAGWAHPFSHFAGQAELMEGRLRPFADEVAEFARTEHDILDQGALLWRLVHKTLATYRSEHPDWVFVRHEDLSRDPLGGYESLFAALELPYTESVREEVRRTSSASNPAERELGDRDFGVRDSSANASNWRRRLTQEEIEHIHRKVADVSSLFYTEDEW